MKILLIANAIFGDDPGLSGGEIRFIELAKCWAKCGHEIHLMSSQGGRKLCNKMGLEVIFHNITDSKESGTKEFLLRALKASFFLPSSLTDFDEGVIYSTNEMIFDVIPALRLKLRSKKRIRWATVVHWLPPFPPWRRKKSSILNSILFFINERISLWLSNWRADVLLPVSSMTEKQLKDNNINMSKVHTVECGVNYEELRTISQTVEKKEYDGVFMKRLQAVKGIFDLIDIWGIVVKNKPDAKLLIIGEGIDGEKAKQIVKQNGLENNINFTGVIYDICDKIQKIAQSRLFLLPTYEENWAIVIGESMACGTPVISYGLKELVDVWKDNAAWIPVGEKEAFAKKIIDLLNDPSVIGEIQRKASDYVKQYDWGIIAKKELKIILGSQPIIA